MREWRRGSCSGFSKYRPPVLRGGLVITVFFTQPSQRTTSPLGSSGLHLACQYAFGLALAAGLFQSRGLRRPGYKSHPQGNVQSRKHLEAASSPGALRASHPRRRAAAARPSGHVRVCSALSKLGLPSVLQQSAHSGNEGIKGTSATLPSDSSKRCRSALESIPAQAVREGAALSSCSG